MPGMGEPLKGAIIMARLLQENEVKKFNMASEMKNYLEKRQTSDVWIEPYVKELEIKGFANNPIGIPVLRKDLEKEGIVFPDFVSNDSIQECMNNQSVFIVLPYEDKMTVFPLRETAYTSILKRVQLGGGSMTRINPEGDVSVLAPEKKGTFINECAKLFERKSCILLQDEMISTVNGGRYVPLNNKVLIDMLEVALMERWDEVSFKNAEASHCFFSAVYDIRDEKWCKRLIETLDDAGFDVESVDIVLKYISSDITDSKAKVVPVITINKKPMIANISVGIEHTSPSLERWQAELDKLFTCVEKSASRIEELAKTKVDDIESCMKDFISKCPFIPTRTGNRYAEEMGVYYTSGTALDVYYLLLDIKKEDFENKGMKLTPDKQWEYMENLSREVFNYVF